MGLSELLLPTNVALVLHLDGSDAHHSSRRILGHQRGSDARRHDFDYLCALLRTQPQLLWCRLAYILEDDDGSCSLWIHFYNHNHSNCLPDSCSLHLVGPERRRTEIESVPGPLHGSSYAFRVRLWSSHICKKLPRARKSGAASDDILLGDIQFLRKHHASKLHDCLFDKSIRRHYQEG